MTANDMPSDDAIERAWRGGQREQALVLASAVHQQEARVRAAERLIALVRGEPSAAEAGAALRLAGELLRAAWPDDPRQQLHADRPLEAWLEDRGRFDEALRLLVAERAAAEALPVLPGESALRDTDLRLGRLYARWNRLAEAERYLLAAAHDPVAWPDELRQTLDAMTELHALYRAACRWPDARRAVEHILSRLPAEDPDRPHWDARRREDEESERRSAGEPNP